MDEIWDSLSNKGLEGHVWWLFFFQECCQYHSVRKCKVYISGEKDKARSSHSWLLLSDLRDILLQETSLPSSPSCWGSLGTRLAPFIPKSMWEQDWGKESQYLVLLPTLLPRRELPIPALLKVLLCSLYTVQWGVHSLSLGEKWPRNNCFLFMHGLYVQSPCMRARGIFRFFPKPDLQLIPKEAGCKFLAKWYCCILHEPG